MAKSIQDTSASLEKSKAVTHLRSGVAVLYCHSVLLTTFHANTWAAILSARKKYRSRFLQ